MLKVLNDHELARRLLDIGGPKLARSTRVALKKSIKIIETAMKAAAPPRLPSVRMAIGSRVARGTEMRAKAGAGVGKKMNKNGMVKHRNRPGVGISAANIHWYVLGTQERETGSKRIGHNSHKRGARPQRAYTGHPVHRTGRAPPHPFLAAAAQAAAPEAYRELMLEINDYVQREFRRSGGAL